MAVTLTELERDPHPALARLRAEEPVAWIDGLRAWLVTRRDVALAVMRDAATFTVDDARFSTGRVVGRSMLTTDGAEHDAHRAPFAAAFRLAAVRDGLAPLVREEAVRLLDALAPAGRADLRRAFAGPLAAAVVTRALGLERVGVDAVLGWYEAIVDATTRVTAGEPVTERARGAVTELRAAVGDEARAPDIAVLLFGGIETTEGMIANALLHLLTHDAPVTPNAIEESLRLEPAAATVDRYATRDVELGGALIGAGDLVTVSIAAANRDPAVFPDPDRFDPGRANAKLHLAFAAGPHVCVGMHLARLEAHTALAMLRERLPGLRLDGPPHPPRGLVFRKPPSLRCAW